ncbi:efflux RND transporter periplasmic adaptor subunit [Paenibacillus arenilitoris]|uniref:Efflux RND transporter periplasmic adaptor subunit n=1 Tax=Paenibacillus arenilitoris TaxID=2772299 RepID=A0A927CHC6_9BACL|nr:efflux RND transporter periplasmic adaptor subunit [Paenibacillus arenilitoris]MBD2867042.1 efflux RND transporter periplasmic adaptor subunit [Paenibacillus arenilitoris]
MKKAVVGALVLVAVSIVGFNVWQLNQSSTTKQEAVNVETYRVEFQELKQYVIASGVAIPAEEERIYLDSGLGQLERILVAEGQKVKAGTPVLRYRADDISNELKEFEISRKRLELELEENKEQLSNLMPELRQELGNITDDTQREEAVRQLGRKKRNLERQQAVIILDIEAIKMQTAALEDKRKRLVVTSGMKGTVQKIEYDSSDYSDNPLIYIVSDQNYKVHGTITEFDHVLVKMDQKVEVKPKVLSGQAWKGIVRSVDSTPVGWSTADSATQGDKEVVTSYPFIVDLLEPSEELKSGYHVYIDIEVEPNERRLAVPHGAILNEEGQEVVLLVREGIIQKRQVTTGRSSDNWKEIVSGLMEGDLIVSSPQPEMREGMPIQTEDAA